MAKTKDVETKPRLIRCTHCAGRKTILALGGFKKECPTCKGIGFVSETK